MKFSMTGWWDMRLAIRAGELAHAGEGHAERKPIRLTEQEIKDVVAFIRSLSGPIVQRPSR